MKTWEEVESYYLKKKGTTVDLAGSSIYDNEAGLVYMLEKYSYKRQGTATIRFSGDGNISCLLDHEDAPSVYIKIAGATGEVVNVEIV